jgi:hypothetical protein
MCDVPLPLIPQTATLMRSFAPIIFPDDLVPLIAKVAKSEDWAMNFRLFSIIIFSKRGEAHVVND